jgi:hypothetical protein
MQEGVIIIMVQEQKVRAIPPEEYQAMQESARQDQQRSLQEGIPGGNKTVQPGIKPNYPTWPTSKPGPGVTTPPPGMRSINPMRSEQVTEVGYNQETGTPSVESPARSLPDESLTGPTSFDQSQTVQDATRKRKQRL